MCPTLSGPTVSDTWLREHHGFLAPASRSTEWSRRRGPAVRHFSTPGCRTHGYARVTASSREARPTHASSLDEEAARRAARRARPGGVAVAGAGARDGGARARLRQARPAGGRGGGADRGARRRLRVARRRKARARGRPPP